MALTTRSELWRRARALIPGGVNSPVRAMRAVGLDEPFFVAPRRGRVHRDVDGRRYSTGCMSWGPLIFGHADPETVEAVREAAARRHDASARRPSARSSSPRRSSTPSRRSRWCGSSPRARRRRCRRSGSRAASRSRDRDASSSPAATTATPTRCSRAPARGSRRSAIPSSPGVPTRRRRRHDRLRPTTTSTRVAAAVERYGEGLACVIVEPVAGNMGVVPPEPGLPRGAARALRRVRRAARLRRGDHRLPRRARRRAGALRRHARPDDPRQDRRRRPAARGVRRPRRGHGAARAGRRRLPGGHALREPARDRGRALGAAAAARPGGLRGARAPRARGSRRASRRSAASSASARC